MTVSWDHDHRSSPQESFEIQISSNRTFNDPVFDTGRIISSSSSYTTPIGIIQFDSTYSTRVRVWRIADLPSSWSRTISWATPPYAYPQTDFIWTPASPSVGTTIQFIDQTIFGNVTDLIGHFDAASWSWNWAFGDGSRSSDQVPTHVYRRNGIYTVNLTGTDAAKQGCTASRTIKVSSRQSQ